MSLAPAPSPNSLSNSKPQTLLLSVLSLGGSGKERKDGLRTWPGLSGPKRSWPTRLAGSQDSVLYKAGRPANPPGLKPERGDYRPKEPATPLKGTVRLGRTGRLPAREALPSRRTQALFGRLPSLQRWSRRLPASSPAAWDWGRDWATCGCRITMQASMGGALRPGSPTGSMASYSAPQVLRPCEVADLQAARLPLLIFA